MHIPFGDLVAVQNNFPFQNVFKKSGVLALFGYVKMIERRKGAIMLPSKRDSAFPIESTEALDIKVTR